MRKTKWLYLLSLSTVTIALVAGVSVWILLRNPPPTQVQVPQQADVRTYAELALALAQQERYSEAMVVNQKALLLRPEHPGLNYNQGWLAAREGKWKEALKSFNKAHHLAPKDVDTLYNLAWVHEQLGQEKAKQADLALLQQLPQVSSTPLEKVRSLQVQEKHAEALKELQKIVPKDPVQKLQYNYLLSRSHLAVQDHQAALQDLNHLLAQSEDPTWLRERAQVEATLGQADAALSDLSRSLELAPNREAALEHARLQIKVSPELALTEIATLKKQNPNWLPLQMLQIQAEMAHKQPRQAQDSLEALLKQHPDNAQIWLLQARLERQRRHYSPAEVALQKALQLGAPRTEVMLEQALLAAQQNQRDTALKYVQQVLAENPALEAKLKQERLLKRWL